VPISESADIKDAFQDINSEDKFLPELGYISSSGHGRGISLRFRLILEEVETALERERRENRLVLFPIRIDDAAMQTDQAWAASIRRTRHIGDFRNWKDHDSYQSAFQRLLRDLKAEATPGRK
jgi:hypothetical protein